MRVLVAFDKFKDSMTAREACDTVAEALGAIRNDCTVDLCPLADGGEGFAEILTRAAGGELRRVPVTGPRGDPVEAEFGLVASSRIPDAARQTLGVSAVGGEHVAVVEMATASGLTLLPREQRDVWHTTTTGTGELLQAAASAKASAIVLGVGGSATNDLGLGALSQLGLQLKSAGNAPITPPVPACWSAITGLSGMLVRLPPIFIACDVKNPLLGPRGAAAVYGPQKGLHATDVSRLDHETARLAMLLCSYFRRSDTLMEVAGAGAAGGIAFGLMVATGARIVPGFDFVSCWLDVAARVAAADVIVTGEGKFDESSLSGKGPGAIAAQGLDGGKPVHVFAGAVTAHSARPGLSLHAITPLDVSLERALREARQNLTNAVRTVFAP